MKTINNIITLAVCSIFIYFFLCSNPVFSQIVISQDPNEEPNGSAMLEIVSDSLGVLIPRMTKEKRDSINVVSTTEGLLIYQTDNTPGFYFYNGTVWLCLNASTTIFPDKIIDSDLNTMVHVEKNQNDNYIRFDVNGEEVLVIDNTGKVGVGTSVPDEKLHVSGKVKIDSMDVLTSDDVLVVWSSSDSTLGQVNYDSIRDLSYASSPNSLDSSVFVDDNGNIGIGTSTPMTRLHVVGDVKIEEMNTLTSVDTLVAWNSSTSTLSLIELDSIKDLSYTSDPGSPISAVHISAIGNIGIGTTSPDDSAILELESTSKGFLPPRMTIPERDAISSPQDGLQIFNTSTNRPNYFNGSVWMHFNETAAENLSIGDFYAGGVIFWLDGIGGGLVCAASDQSSFAEWGCYLTVISGADGTVIGTGAQNTIDIEAGCSTPGTAADICANLSLNGYTDWFLPSKDELNEMYQNKAIINVTAMANGGSELIVVYWSSTESSDELAWIQDFAGVIPVELTKDNSKSVRAIRAF